MKKQAGSEQHLVVERAHEFRNTPLGIRGGAEAFVLALKRSENPRDREALVVLEQLSTVTSSSTYIDAPWDVAWALRESSLAVSSGSRDYLITVVQSTDAHAEFAQEVYAVLRKQDPQAD